MKTNNAQRLPGLYEAGPLRDITGPAIRPGGLTLTGHAVEYCGFASGVQLLDVGCGPGATVEHLRSRFGFDARGVDISPVLIAEGLARNPSLPLTVASAGSLPYGAESLDGLFCECVLSLIDEPLQALKEFNRVLRSCGTLILSDIYCREEPGTAANTSGRATRSQIEAWLSECGFTTTLWEDHTLLLKELAARLILAQGSLEGFCCGTNGVGARPGYYLLVAGKV